MKNIFGIVGWSGSGKTHLICRIIKYFDKKKINICSIKHSHHNFEIDKKGKDRKGRSLYLALPMRTSEIYRQAEQTGWVTVLVNSWLLPICSFARIPFY